MISRAFLRHPSRARILLKQDFLRYSSSLKQNGQFFKPNQEPKTILDAVYRDEAQLKLQKYMNSRKQFHDPNETFFVSPHRNVESVILENTFEPTQTWEQIVSNNRNLPPSAGSIVEFFDAENDRNCLGIVVKELQSKFNESHNKLIVLTLKNELTRVYPQNINFNAFQVLDAEWIHSLDILYHRFDEEYSMRLELGEILHLFMDKTRDYQGLVQKELRKVYANLASQDNANATSLLAVVSQMNSFHLKSYFDQSALLMAIHLEMSRDASRWIVLLCLPKHTTNLSFLHCSNELPHEIIYFGNSLTNNDSVTHFLDYDDAKLDELNTFLLSLIEHPRDYDDLTLLLNIWQGKDFLHAFKAMTFALFYPHTSLMEKFAKVKIFQSKDRVRIKDLQDLFRKIGLYDCSKNPLTDIVISANIFGKPSLDQLAVSSPKDLRPSPLELRSARMLSAGELDDKFRHLRNSKKYYQDHVIYVLPSNQSYSYIGVSLEKINARKYLINVHVPDVAARIPPGSTFFEELVSYNFSLESLKGLIDRGLIEILAKNVRDELSLRTQGLAKSGELFRVGDFENTRIRDHKSKTCMTLSFEYNTFALSPLKELGNLVTVTFDRINNVKVKELTWEALDDILAGRLESGILNPFKLFNRFKEAEEQKPDVSIDEHDILNLGFIYNVMKTHFSMRNSRCASAPPPSNLKRVVSRALSYEKKEELEVMKTTLTLPTVREAARLSRALFFTDEVQTFLESLVASYCNREAIPVLARHDGLLEPSDKFSTLDEAASKADEVLVSHNNKLLPNYYCSSYYQAIMAKDRHGYVSLPAFFIGNNYLGKQTLVTSNESPYLLTKGLPMGRVIVANAIGSVEAYLNQLQILAHLHLQETAGSTYLKLVIKTSHLKASGYPVHGPLSAKFLASQITRLRDTKLGNRFLVEAHTRFWKLRYLEQELMANAEDEAFNLSCVVTSIGHEIDSETKLARAWCLELAMEVDMLIHPYSDLTMGSTATVDKVLYIDAAEGQCIVRCQDDY